MATLEGAYNKHLSFTLWVMLGDPGGNYPTKSLNAMRKVVKRKKSGIKEMEYVVSKTRRGKTGVSLRSVSWSPSPPVAPLPSPSKSRRSSGFPSKWQCVASPAMHIVGNDIYEIMGGRKTKVSESRIYTSSEISNFHYKNSHRMTT